MRRSRLLISGFNPRTRVGCDSPPTNRIFAAQEFQSTHPRGVRLAALLGLSIRVTVSIHAPAWGATTSIWQARNSRPVSIHAPAWGATCRHVRQRACLRVSIHAPAWGATPAQPAAGTTAGRFQSTHPRGVRLHFHAISLPEGAGFNPRTRVGCDSSMAMPPAMASLFQSTHPRGVRPHLGYTDRHRRAVSIHAPAWGATSCPRRATSPMRRFQSTHPRGVRPFPRRLGKDGALVSIHAPAWGATRRVNDAALRGLVSIHAPAWGATLISVYVAIF